MFSRPLGAHMAVSPTMAILDNLETPWHAEEEKQSRSLVTWQMLAVCESC